MHVSFVVGVALSMLLSSVAVALAADSATASGPRRVKNNWDASWFNYDRPDRVAVELRTPTKDQIDWTGRPRRMPADDALIETTKAPTPITVKEIDLIHIRFRDVDGEIVPALLATPHGKTGPFPVVIATHGLTSNKAQVIAQVAPEMIKRGYAVLAADMPLHGERPGDPNTFFSANPLRAFEIYRQAVRDVRQLIDVAQALPQLDAKARVSLIGYSMGSWISSVVGPSDDRVKSMVLMVGGANEPNADYLFIPQYAAVQPQLAIAHFAPRPVLMLNGKSDYTVTPSMARRLFAGASEPKEQIWYASGHLLPDEAYVKAAEWIAEANAR